MKKKLFFAFLTIIFFGQNILAQGCSQCKLVAEQGSEMDESSFGSNINSGIIYLMIIPYLIIMFIFRKQILNFLKGIFAKKA
ncbi:MAG: hypothetical protein ACK5B9_10530 [Flavobacteriia bacterium]|jgi:hypothetical protein